MQRWEVQRSHWAAWKSQDPEEEAGGEVVGRQEARAGGSWGVA